MEKVGLFVCLFVFLNWGIYFHCQLARLNIKKILYHRNGRLGRECAQT